MDTAELMKVRQRAGLMIETIMKERGLNKTELHEAASITRRQLYGVLNGKREYTINTLMKVLNALNCKMIIKDNNIEIVRITDIITRNK